MRIYSDISEIEFDKDTVITIGAFDGLHVGHRELLRTVCDKAREYNGRSFLVTFDPHPRTVVSSNYRIGLLTSLKEKLELFETFGIENVLVINFTREFSQLGFRKFITDYIIKPIGLKHIVLGYDHRFGKDRAGDEEKLRSLADEYNFDVTVVNEIMVDDEVISSTKIRKALEIADLSAANKYLGYNYKLYGTVIPGAKRGRKIGFPTANIKPHDETKLVPPNGVYFVKIAVKGSEYNGIMNIGVRPTFNDTAERVIEVHLLNFSGDIYAEEIKIEFVHKIRDEKKFSSKEELTDQIRKDKEEALLLLNKLN